jgi:four helix bundle protein
MLRSGTSPAPNYGEARAVESSDDFIHKLKVVLKELNETLVWLQVIQRGKMIPAEELKAAMDECDQLCRIVAASINTARRRRDGK